jgi:thermitase
MRQLKRRSVRALAAAAVLALPLVGAHEGGAAAKPRFERSTVLVKFEAPAQAAGLVRRLGDRLAGFAGTGVAIVKLQRGEQVERKVAQYKALPAVAYAEPNFLAHGAVSAPTDPSYRSQWNLAKVAAVPAWTAYPGSYDARSAVKLGVIDTGVDSTHQDLDDGRVLTSLGANCLSGTCAPDPALDDNGHGTHVAGIADAETNNGTGIAGLGYPVQLVPVKALAADNTGSYAAIASGIMWAVRQGARVLNLSIVGSVASPTLCDAVAQATSRGVLVVAAAGNNGNSAASYPASCSGAVGVSATDSTDGLASFSSFGRGNVFVSAPGASITSTFLRNSYRQLSGTSMASPHVAALSALLLAQVPTRTVADLKVLLATTSDKVGSGYGADPYGTCGDCTWSAQWGYGRINAERALAATGAAVDYTVSASPFLRTISAGTAGEFDVTVTAANGFADPVQFSVSGLPLGATASFSPSEVAGSGASRLTVTTLAVTVPGSYQLTISGTSGSRVRTASATLAVTVAAAPVPVPLPTSGFSMAVSSPTRGVTKAGVPALFTVTLTPDGILSEPVVLSISGLPDGATAVFAPPVVAAPGAAVLTVKTELTTPPGRYVLVITGSTPTLERSVTTHLDVS